LDDPEKIFVDVWLPLSVPGAYTYRIPREWTDKVEPGMRVLVSFGKKKLYAALVVDKHARPPQKYEAKYILEILDAEPIVNEKNIHFWKWMSKYYFSTPGDVLRCALPSGFKIESDTLYFLSENFPEKEFVPEEEEEQVLLELFRSQEKITINDIRNKDAKPGLYSVFRKWLNKGWIVMEEEWEERYKPRIISYIRIHPEVNTEELLPKLEKRAFEQAACILWLMKEQKKPESPEEGWIEKNLLLEQFSAGVVRSMIKKGILEEMEAPVSRLKFKKYSSEKKELKLSPGQEKAWVEIEKIFKEGYPVLLHGVTGSGKTEIFLRCMEEVLRQGKQVLYLLPEIALTMHHIHRLREKFGNKVGIYHSRFNIHERVEIWHKVLENNKNKEEGYAVVLAPRSGIFLPFSRLGLIVIDEEQDASYKQQNPSPRYSARDAALFLSRHIYDDCNVILGSATPLAESYFLAKSGVFHRVELKEKYFGDSQTELVIADMNKEYSGGKEPVWFGEILREKATEVLKEGRQVLMFVGRRGYSLYYRCEHCRHVVMCRQCDVPLVYHKQPGHLLCHYCGYALQIPGHCEKCGSRQMQFAGGGTERIEEYAGHFFEGYTVERMDLDSTRSRDSFENMMQRFEEGKTRILIGTHMITKGLDFSKVGLVAIPDFDRQLHFPDFRAFERAFQLARQLQGRASRRGGKGYFIIQTYLPDHPVIQFLKSGSEEDFYEFVLKQRKEHAYPPYYRLMEIDFKSEDKELCKKASDKGMEIIQKHFEGFNKEEVRLLGPEWPVVSKIRGWYIRRILLKYRRNVSHANIHERMEKSLDGIASLPEFKKVRVSVNPDPM